MYRRGPAVLVFLCLAASAQAATRQIDFTVTFDATVAWHSCRDVIAQEGGGDGACEGSDELAPGTSLAATLTLSGDFEQIDGAWRAVGPLSSMTCRMGQGDCLASLDTTVVLDDDSLSVRPYGDFAARYVFDLGTASGTHFWVAETMPFTGKGEMTLTGVDVSGIPVATEVPLPAGLVLLIGALALLVPFGAARKFT